MSYRVGIDVGGTFTDFLVIGSGGAADRAQDELDARRPVGRRRHRARRRSPPCSASTWRRSSPDTEAIVHGTTVTTNAVLTRRGARTGLLATKGFRDALALRNGLREEPYDNRLQPPVPLVPRYLRLGIEGRVDWAGDEVTPLSLDDVRAACETFRGEGIEAVAISFMHSPANAEHERRARDLCRELLP